MTTRLAVATLAAALSLASCGEESSPPATSTPAATTSASVFDNALWPDPASATVQDGPLDVARSFLKRFVGVENPALGEFQQGDSRSGEVHVLRRREDGTVLDKVIATIAMRQLDGTRWFVIFAGSDEVKLSSPRAGESEAMPTITSPVTVAGTGVGFEGNILVRVHAAFDPKPIAEVAAQGGSMKIEPFSTELEFERRRARTGVIVARAGSGLPGAEPFAAIGVRFASG